MSKPFVSDITMNTLTPEVPEAPEVGMDPYFKSVWMNEACKHAMRPNSAVDHLNKTLEKRLAFHLRAHLGQKKTKNVGRQAIFSILGYSYVRNYLPDETFDISCLEPSDITSAQKETALSLARTQLKELVDKTCQDVGLDLMGANPSRFSGSDAIQLEVDAVWNEAVEKYMRTGKKLKVKKDVKGKKVKKGMKLDDGALVHWTNVEDIAGQVVAELCACDPTLLQQLKDTFIKKNYSLPSSLRLFIIQNYLFSKGDIQVHRESFKDTVSRNSKEMKLERATRCRIWQTIDSAIIEVYGRVPTLKLYDSDAHDAEAAHILNVLHVYNKTYDPTLIIWLFPLQMIVTKAIKDEDAVVVDLAMYLDTMSRSCVASARDVTDLTDTVVDTWQQWDKELHKHIIQSMNVGLWVNAKDFPLGILSPDKEEARKILEEIKSTNSSSLKEFYQKLLTRPSLFIRKWIAEGFVSILSLSSLYFVWDQLFLSDWDKTCVRDVCLTLLFLLKRRFLRARNYFAIRDVFLADPGRLETNDIRRAWDQVRNGNSFEGIPGMDRNLRDNLKEN